MAKIPRYNDFQGHGEKTSTVSPGQIQIVNNHKLDHRRTGFADWPKAASGSVAADNKRQRSRRQDEDRRRHLVRIWVRHEGKRFHMG